MLNGTDRVRVAMTRIQPRDSHIVGWSASQNAIGPNFDARFERLGLFFPTIKIARANAARGANDSRYLVLLLTFPHHGVMTGQTEPNHRKSIMISKS